MAALFLTFASREVLVVIPRRLQQISPSSPCGVVTTPLKAQLLWCRFHRKLIRGRTRLAVGAERPAGVWSKRAEYILSELSEDTAVFSLVCIMERHIKALLNAFF